MATKTFGQSVALTNAAWAGTTSYVANLGLRATMPEPGTVISIAVKLANNGGTTPIVWGVIWDRTAGAGGAIICRSATSKSPSNAYTSAGAMVTYTFDLPPTYIAGGKLLWIGHCRNTSDANRSLYYGWRTGVTGAVTEYQDIARTQPGAFSAVTGNLGSNCAMHAVVTYITGGKVKVWNGTTSVEKPLKVWNGTAWVEKKIKVWNGTTWKESA